MPTNPTIIKPLCIIHCRVSSARQAQQGESLEVQAEICGRIALSRGWLLAHEPWIESYSGRKERPVFKTILEYVDDHPGEIQYYLFRSIDRFTRAGSLVYEEMKRELTKRRVQLIDSFGIIQPIQNTLERYGFEYDWSRSSPSEISEVVIAASNKQEVTTILTRLIGQEIELAQRGYKLRAPSDGYINAKIVVDGHKHTIQRPDPERAHFLLEMFALRASGQHTDNEICQRLNAMGYRTKRFNRWDGPRLKVIGRSGGLPLTTERLQALIQRPIYCGIVCEKWTHWKPVRAPYEGLVSFETFNAANRGKIRIGELMDGKVEIIREGGASAKAARNNERNPLFPYRGVLACAVCRKPLWASSPRGRSGKRFPAYHCARKHPYVGIRKSVIEDALWSFVGKLRFHHKAGERIHQALTRLYRECLGEIEERASAVSRNIEELEVRKASALNAFKLATTDLVRKSMEAEALEYDEKIRSAQTVSEKLAIGPADIDAFVEDIKRTLEHPAILLKSPDNTAQLRALYSLVFEDLPTYEELTSGTAKLSLFIKLSSPSETEQTVLVRLRQIGWNPVEAIILRWKQDAPLIRAALSTTSPKS